MTRRAMTVVALLTTTMLITLSGATTATAELAPPEPRAEVNGPVITVKVWGSGYTKQEGGSSGGARQCPGVCAHTLLDVSIHDGQGVLRERPIW